MGAITVALISRFTILLLTILSVLLNGCVTLTRAFDATLSKNDEFILVGSSCSDGWISKVDKTGNANWERHFANQVFINVSSTADGGYIVIGGSSGARRGRIDFGPLRNNIVYSSHILSRLDSQGNLLWTRDLGGSIWDRLLVIIETSDGRFVTCGHIDSKGAGELDGWVVMLSQSGNLLWERTFGGPESDFFTSIEETEDHGYILSGVTGSNTRGGADAWLVKLDRAGSKQWERTYGGNEQDWISNVHQTRDGGYIAVGFTESMGSGGSDGWVLKLDAEGRLR